MKTALVLLSGGQDSTTALYWAKHVYGADVIHTLSLYYGQRHHVELSAARMVSTMAGVESHVEVDLGTVMIGGASALLLGNENVITGSGGLPDAEMPQGLPTSFVPGRNLMFLAIAAARAGAVGADVIVTGVCQTDYSGYPDCRVPFIKALQGAVDAAWPSEVNAPAVLTPLMHMTKAETVRLARELPGCWDALALSVTCYHGKVPGCGTCPSCTLRARGFADAGETDPASVVAS
jgi:7-cyano-7-deazaguanine synthase